MRRRILTRPDLYDLFGMGEGERAKKHRVDNAEDRREWSDGDSERQYRDDRECGTALERPHGREQVLAQRVHVPQRFRRWAHGRETPCPAAGPRISFSRNAMTISGYSCRCSLS